MSKEELLKQVEMLKEKQKEENELIEKLQKQIEDIDKESKIWWTPNKGDDYYYISGDGYITSSSYNGGGCDIDYKNNINAYKTKEETERIAFEQLLHRKLVKFAFENNDDKEFNWNDLSQNKYYINYDGYRKEMSYETNQIYKKQGVVYFTTAEIAEKSIKEFKKDLIRYFTTSK